MTPRILYTTDTTHAHTESALSSFPLQNNFSQSNATISQPRQPLAHPRPARILTLRRRTRQFLPAATASCRDGLTPSSHSDGHNCDAEPVIVLRRVGDLQTWYVFLLYTRDRTAVLTVKPSQIPHQQHMMIIQTLENFCKYISMILMY